VVTVVSRWVCCRVASFTRSLAADARPYDRHGNRSTNFGIWRRVAAMVGVEADAIAMAASRARVRHVASLPSVVRAARCGVCAAAIISQSSSLLPRRPTARATHTHTRTHRRTKRQRRRQTKRRRPRVCWCVVRCGCVCVRVTRVKGRRSSPSGTRTRTDLVIASSSSSIGFPVSGD